MESTGEGEKEEKIVLEDGEWDGKDEMPLSEFLEGVGMSATRLAFYIEHAFHQEREQEEKEKKGYTLGAYNFVADRWESPDPTWRDVKATEARLDKLVETRDALRRYHKDSSRAEQVRAEESLQMQIRKYGALLFKLRNGQ